MPMDRLELERLLSARWGEVKKPPSYSREVPLLCELVAWDDLQPDAKCLVLELLAEHAGCIGSHSRDGDAAWICQALVRELQGGGRSGPLVRRALSVVYDLEIDGWGAVVTPFVFAELEAQLKAISRAHLRYDGKVVAPLPAGFIAKDKKAGYAVGARISSIGDVYDLAMHVDPAAPLQLAIQRFDERYRRGNHGIQDPDTTPYEVQPGVWTQGKPLPALRDYLRYLRNAIVHGSAHVLIGEGFYTAMLLGIFIVHRKPYGA